MTLPGGEPVDLDEIFGWYLSACNIIADLDVCRVIVDSMLSGSASSNMLIAEGLDSLTQSAELWLLTHPCPEHLNADDLSAIVRDYQGFGALIVATQGAPDGPMRIALQDMAKDASMLLDEVRGRVAMISKLLDA